MNQRVKELLKNTAIIGIGRISTQIVSFLLIPLYTNLLSTEEYGAFDLYTSAVSLLLPIITLQIELAAYKYIITNRENEQRIKSLFSTAVLFVAVGVTIFFFLFLGISRIVKVQEFLLLFLYIASSVMFVLENNIVRAFGDNKNYTIASFIVSLATIILNIVTLCGFGIGVKGLLISITSANLLGSLYLLYKNHLLRYFSVSVISMKELKLMLTYSVPLIPNELSWWIVKGSDKMVVTYFLGIGFNGILAMGTKFATIFQSVVNIFIIAWTENAILYYEKGKESFNKIVNQLICMFGWLAVFIIMGVGFVFPYMVAEAYVSAYFLIPLYIVAVYLYCVGGIFGAVYLAENRTGEVTKSTAAAGFVNLIADIILIRWIGIYAAAVSSILGYAVMAFYRTAHLKEENKFKVEKRGFILIAIGFILAIISYTGSFPIKIVASFGGGGLFIISNRRIIGSLIKKLRG